MTNKTYNENNANENFELGLQYYEGRGVKKDFKEAFTAFHKAAEQGHAIAQCNLGLMYDNGEGVRKDYKKALEWYKKAAEQGLAKAVDVLKELEILETLEFKAEQGDVDAQYELATIYHGKHDSMIVQENDKKTLYWYKKAAEQGHGDAAYELLLRFFSGLDIFFRSIPRDIKAALHWAEKITKEGKKFKKEAGAILEQIFLEINGIVIPEKGPQVDLYLEERGIKEPKYFIYQTLQAAEHGLANAQYEIGSLYFNGFNHKKHIVRQDFEKALYWFQKAAEQGFAEAQFNLGLMYHNGKGVEKDLSKAVSWYQKAAEQGHAKAQLDLGVMYHNGGRYRRWDVGFGEVYDEYDDGERLEKDLSKAVYWYQKAAEQGYASAQYILGLTYRHGDGVEKDYEMAFKWYQKAAAQGFAEAQFNLGLMYHNGEGVEQDLSKAMSWFQKAAEQGLAVAQFNLGSMHADGQGVPQDYKKALELYQKAAEQGHADAINTLEYLEKK
ncbi:MAG: SEL1-like repeat protein [Deltaproteobacteria bacterium]|nr:SEL1-like repeat protein [Deltaproteobacteria bacterium]